MGKAAREPKMKMTDARREMIFRATEALKSVLSQVSTLKLKEIRRVSAASGGETGLVAWVDVLGRSHTLACAVKTDAHPSNLLATLRELHESAARVAGDATPVLIATYLSPEAQALCKESRSGFLDLEGNARIDIGEIFIGKRTFALRHVSPPMVRNATDVPHGVRRASLVSHSPAVVAVA
jgi:hypothetical protein